VGARWRSNSNYGRDNSDILKIKINLAKLFKSSVKGHNFSIILSLTNSHLNFSRIRSSNQAWSSSSTSPCTNHANVFTRASFLLSHLVNTHQPGSQGKNQNNFSCFTNVFARFLVNYVSRILIKKWYYELGKFDESKCYRVSVRSNLSYNRLLP
jgi:hypothetical protein